MWPKRQLDNINSHNNSLAISSNSKAAAIIFGAIRDKYENVVWLEITDKEKDDPVALGNILSDAVKRALGSKLFDYGLPYNYGLKVLENQLELLGPFYFLVSNAASNSEFSKDILKLNKYGSKVVLSFCANKPLNNLADSTYIIQEEDLLLKKTEARDLANELADKDFEQIWKESKGKYLVFLTSLNKRLNIPLPVIPSPTSNRLLDEDAYEVDPDLLLNILVKKERWLDVLEVAVLLLPHRVPEIIAKAGYYYNEIGQTKRLWELLSELPKSIQLEEDVLFWLLSSAFWQGKAEELRDDVEAHLKNNEAAELRALYAGVLAAPEDRLKEARTAYNSKKTSNTTYILGNFEQDINTRIELLQHSLKLAEIANKGYEIVRNATGLVRNLMHLGEYRDALYWSEWALKELEAFHIRNNSLSLWLFSHWANLRILLSDKSNLFSTLFSEESNLRKVAPYQVMVYRENLGDYLLSIGDVNSAFEYYNKNWKASLRQYMGRSTFNLVKLYLWQGDYKKAFRVISQARALISKGNLIQQDYLNLAFACTMVMVNKQKGIKKLLLIRQDKAFEKWKSEQKIYLFLYLAWGYIQIEEINKAKTVLKESNLDKINFPNAGLLVFAGPEDKFKQVWFLIGDKNPILELRFVEKESSFWFQNEKIKLTEQEKEILAILANNPKGLSIEQLALRLSLKDTNLGRIKSAMTRLRKKIPITKDKYKIDTDYSVDFLDIMTLANNGKLRRAMDMYAQILLEKSNSEEIIRIRDILHQTVRNAVLQSDDVEVIMDFAEYTNDDLEIWEKLFGTISASDNRIPYIKARITQIRKNWS